MNRSSVGKAALAWLVAAVVAGAANGGRAAADEPPKIETVTHAITGLLQPDRVDDLREVVATLPELELVSVDYDAAEATFRYDRKKAFNGGTDEQVVQRLDDKLRGASRATFGAKPRVAPPSERLTRVEIPVLGCACKGCSLAAYESIYKIDGVERATASFKEGLVVAWIDPAKTGREALEDALKKRNVTLKSDAEKKAE